MGLFGKKAKPHTPKEQPDNGRSKQFVRIVEVISEGEIQGLVNEQQSVFLDNTPLKNADGSDNFNNVEIDGREGTQIQTVMMGFDTTEKEISVGTEIRKKKPLVRTITDSKVSRLRLTLGVSSLFQQEDNGDTNGSQVDFVITVGKRTYSLTISGKYSSQYLRNVVIDDLPSVPFTVKVERLQDDSKSQRLQNKTLWASYTEIIDTPFAYPNTALVGIKFDSEYFSTIPTRSYEIYGIKVLVPSNYDPVTRTYSGVWNGTFKLAYCNNPAWVLMDIVTNKRYGLGQRLGEFGVDKWALYQVAQYCDQMVPDGFGNTEPRFTCNVWLTEQRSAYDVINDICSIFRAMPVWNGTELTVIMDRPSDPVWTYTNANVIGGQFSRQYSAIKARHNAIQVEYQDATNNYEKAIEYVSNDDIRRYGLNLRKVKAFGCTSRGQAYRTGRWILETERLETETITFSVGVEGLMHIPGDIIQVADNHYAGTDIGGRVIAVKGKQVTLDREITLSGKSVLSYLTHQGQSRHLAIRQVQGAIVTLAETPTDLIMGSVWSLSTPQLSSRLYRAMSITENEDGSYTITALQHEPQKEAIVDNGAVFEPVATSLHQTPKVEHLDVGLSAGNAKFNWQTTSGVGTVTYDIRLLKGTKLYAYHKGLTSSELALDDLPDGEYEIIIQAKNASGQLVSEKRQRFTINRPPTPKQVSIIGNLSDISLSWDYVDNATYTEIWASERDDIRTAERVAKVLASVYSHTIGASQTRYYWLRHTRGQNIGAFSQQAGLRGETGVNVEAEMQLLEAKLATPIINQVFDTVAPARGLEFVKTVANLTNPKVYQQANLVFNQADKKQYRWDGRRYTATVPSGDIEGLIPTTKLAGQLRDAQIASLSATKLSGKVGKAQLDPVLLSDISNTQRAISQETQARITALQQEAQARGNAINALERVDNEQAQQIQAITAKTEQGLSGVQEERLARARDNQATATQLTTLTATVGGLNSALTVADTRNDNRSPSWYWQNHPKRTVNEFKSAQAIGLAGIGFCTLQTVIAWSDPSGNPITQTAINALGRVYHRQSNVAYTGSGRNPTYTRDEWTAWGEDETVIGAQAKADAVKAIAQVAQQAAQTAQADIVAERTARVSADEALTRQGASLSSRLQQAEATVSQQSQTVTRLDGTVQSLHTIRTETIAGGRKAVAGLSLGSRGGTESSLILMADRTQFVKNSQDSSPKALLTIANNQMVLNGDLIATGGITARHLATNSVSTGSLQAGAIRGHHVAAGELTADKLAIGLGGNLLYNPIFANDANGWAHSTYSARLVSRIVSQSHSWVSKQRYLPNENLAILVMDTSSSSIANGARVGYFGQFDIPVMAGKTYMFSAYVSAHRCKARLLVSGRNTTNGYPFDRYSQYSTGSFKDSIDNASRIFCKFTIPRGQEINRVELFMLAEKDGAYNNAMLFMMRPMLEECTEHTREPSPWQNAGVTLIHGGSLITQTVTAQQLAAGSVTTEKLVAGAVNARHIAANTVGAQHVQARSLSAEKLNIQSLSSVSANLGTITAGSININNRFKVNTSGQVEMRSAANNVGMVMNNDQIIVYDTQGRIRVKIGRL